jgi:PHD/YefM family antitoxin component YafN of YafNO toxin-antitoxin module
LSTPFRDGKIYPEVGYTMSITLTPDQQQELDKKGKRPKRVVDPRTDTAYVLVPEDEYEAMRALLEDERRKQVIHATALRNAANRLDEIP